MSEDNIRDHVYPLTEFLEYDSEGSKVQAEFITMRAPSGKNRKQSAKLKQAFIRALPEPEPGAIVPDANADAPKIAGQDVVMMIARSNVDLDVVFENARTLLTSGVAKIDGKINLTTTLMDNLGGDDFEGVIGEYLANFTLKSVLASGSKS